MKNQYQKVNVTVDKVNNKSELSVPHDIYVEWHLMYRTVTPLESSTKTITRIKTKNVNMIDKSRAKHRNLATSIEKYTSYNAESYVLLACKWCLSIHANLYCMR